MASIKVVLRKKKNSEGKYPIAIRITENRKSSYLQTGVYIDVKYWNDENSKVKKSHPNAVKINNLLAQKLAKVNDKYMEMEAKGKVVSASQIKNNIKKPKEKITFYEFSYNYLKNLKDSNKLSQHSSDSARIKHFNNFMGRKDFLFSEITELELNNFKAYLKKLKRPLSDRSIVNNLVVIRTLFNQAIREEIVDAKHYPFGKNKVRIKFPESVKVGLSENEILAIEKLDLEYGSTINHIRNAWLFSFYMAGIRVSDLLRLKWSDVHENRLGYAMGKNKKADSLKIPEKALRILDYYIRDKQSSEDYIFPELKKAKPDDPEDAFRKIKSATKKFDKYLSRIAALAGIEKKITNHISRHTFGNITGDKIPPQLLKKLYRHSSLTTTLNYQANFITKNEDEALDKILDF